MWIAVAILALAFICGIYMGSKYGKPAPKESFSGYCFSEMISRYITPTVGAEIMDSVEEYDSQKYIPKSVIDESGLIHHRYTGSKKWNYLKGCYHGLPVEMCNYRLNYRSPRSEQKEKHMSVAPEQIFKGTWFVCHLNRSFPEELRVVKDGKHLVKTGDSEFDHSFYVECNTSEFANRILTPKMRKALIQLKNVQFDLKTNGDLIIAKDDEKLLFTTEDINESIVELRQRMTREAAEILQVLDILPINEIR